MSALDECIEWMKEDELRDAQELAKQATADLAALNARVEELENAVELTLEWCGEDLPDDVKKALRNVLKGAE